MKSSVRSKTAVAARTRLKSSTRRRLVGVALITPVVVILVVFFVYPLIGVAIRSFTEPVTGLDNYRQLYRSAGFRAVFRKTFEVAALTTVVSLVLGYPFAFHVSQMSRRRAAIFLILSTIPLWTAILARLYAWTVLLGRQGIINRYLISLGIIDEPLDLLFNRTSVIIGMVHVMLPLMIIILYSVMRGIDPSLWEAAQSLGANGLETFRRVFLPLSMPGVYAGSLLVFLISLGFFIAPAILGGGGDITIAMFVQVEVNIYNWGVATAMSMVLLVATAVLFYFFNRILGADRAVIGGLRQ